MRVRLPPLPWVAACLVLGSLTACQSRPASNLVVICIDTVRYDSFMLTGLTDALTPWIDKAQVYENATASGPWTMPSVASVLTGLHPVQHTAGRFPGEAANLATQPPSPLPGESRTITERLRESGFRAGAFVSHPFFHAELGLDQGFELVAPRKGWEKDLERFREWRAEIAPEERFFGYLHFMEAHDWHLGSREALRGRLGALGPEIRQDVIARTRPDNCQEPDALRCLRHQVYNAAVLELRRAVASVLRDLEDSGMLDSTVVLVYSDHGEEFWEHEDEQQLAAQDPRKFFGFGHGQNLFQQLLHVPLLAWIPGERGARHEPLVSLVDIYPSALAWLGLDSEEVETAGHVLPTRRNGSVPADRVIYSSGIAYGPEKMAARSAELKAIFTPHADHFAYYDLAADPGEHEPLLDRPDLTMLFDTLVGDYLEQAGAAAVTATRFTDDQILQLKAIGYLQGYQPDASATTSESPAPAVRSNGDSEEDQP